MSKVIQPNLSPPCPLTMSLIVLCPCARYVPALRPLRQQAFLLSFPQTAPSRLAQRLGEVWSSPSTTPCMAAWAGAVLSSLLPQIAQQQGMRADMGALLALCKKAENDIRSCINTLQVCVVPGAGEGSTSLMGSGWRNWDGSVWRRGGSGRCYGSLQHSQKEVVAR